MSSIADDATAPVLGFEELLRSAQRTAVHLEMRDSYAVSDEAADFARWCETGERDLDPASDYWGPWVRLVAETVGRGVVMRRARIVSLPASDYIRFEHAGTKINLDAGEQVRWLARRDSADIALPGVDFWLVDDVLVRWNHFAGNGDWADPQAGMGDDPAVAKLCASAFESVWERGTPHADFKLV